MRKIFTSFFLVALVTANVFAQTNPAGNLTIPKRAFTSTPVNPKIFNDLKFPRLRSTGPEWFSYFESIVNYNKLNTKNLYTTFLFPDSGITVNFEGGNIGTPFVHSIATVLDPTSAVFNYGNQSYQFTATNSYTVDTIGIPFTYSRNAAANVVDTLAVTVFDNSPSKNHQGNLGNLVYTDSIATVNFNVDTVKVKSISYNPAAYQPIVSGGLVIKIPLTAAILADTLPGGICYQIINTSALGTVDAGALVAVTASFIPGYSYTPADTLNKLNYVKFFSLDENGLDTFPYYHKGDYNQSYIVNTSVQYNISPSGFNGLYIPTVAFQSSYLFDDHAFAFYVNCASCTGKPAPAHCSANFNLYQDPNKAHHWFALNEATGDTPITYIWSWGDGNSDTGQIVSHTYASPGYYTICLIITDDTACTSSFCDSSVYISRMEAGNAMVTIDVVNTLPKPVTSTAATNIINLSVTPNPCTACQINGVTDITDLQVMDLLGRNVTASFTKSSGNIYQMNLPNRNGLFFVRDIKTGVVVKFVKE